MATDLQERARRLAAGVSFAPEAHTEYTAPGFAGSPRGAPGRDRPTGDEVLLHPATSIRLHGPGTR